MLVTCSHFLSGRPFGTPGMQLQCESRFCIGGRGFFSLVSARAIDRAKLQRRPFVMASHRVALLTFYFSFLAVVAATPSTPGVGHVVEENNRSVLVLDLQQDFKNLLNSHTFQFAVGTPDEVTQFFSIDSSNGQISTRGPIDRESLNFSASDAFTFRVFSSPGPKVTNVRIFVDDINDNTPQFPAVDSENATILENAEVGKVISSPSAYDPDIGNNTVQTYSGVIASGNEGGHFNLRQTKLDTHRLKMEFVLAKSLDRETQQYYQFNVTVADGGETPRSAWILFNLTVMDVNDNSPSFDQTSLTLDVPEDMATDKSLLQVQATDLDENPLLRYSMVSITPSVYNGMKTMDMFSIDANTGEIKLLEPLDYEFSLHRKIDLAVSVFDGSHTDSAVVNLFVKDVNDNSPHIVSVHGRPTSLEEDFTPGKPFMFLFASDRDSDINNTKLGFNLTGGKGYFNLTYLPFGSLYRADVQLTRSLDREDIDKFDLMITIFDHGVPQLTASWSDTLTVLDVNDNSPTFVTGPYSETVDEDIAIDSLIVTVSAEDPDAGANGTVEYLIPSDQPLFQWFAVDSAGVVKTAQNLDREIAGVINLTVTARDKGTPPLSTNTTVTIILKDVNDNSPMFNQSRLDVQVPENESIGVVVATVTATDPDEGVFGDVTYVVVGETSKNVFILNPQSGEFRLNATLDRESTADYTLVVDAQDGGGRTSSLNVFVVVTDINEHHPEFYPSHYDCVIYENTTVGHRCVIVHATDKDQNKKVTYDIISGNDNSDFSLDRHSGELVTSNTLDHERQDFYVLAVSATDSGGLQSNPAATVNVTVANVLDKPPLFVNLSYAFTLNETDSPGTTVGRVSAIKQDAAKNGQLMYFISSGDVQGKFDIDMISGTLSLKKSIDREEVDFYQLHVEAHCCGPTPLIAMAMVNITVTDANDNAPKFSVLDGKTLRVHENEPVGFVIASLSAADKDEGLNSNVYYHLTAERDGLFVVNRTTGNLSLSQSLDYESLNKTDVTVTAYDRGSPQQSTSIVLAISVIDVNDNRPVFSLSAYRMSVLENVSLAHTVLRVSSSDLDSGTNSEISYSLDAGTDLPFTIIATGDIYTVGKLDAETTQSYDFNVTAKDNGQPSLSATAPVHIDVLDVNDNWPVFDPTVNLSFSVIENVKVGHPIGQVVATDKDNGQNGEVEYSFEKPSSTFQVDPSSGKITTTGTIDRETKDLYSLTVAASDHGAVKRITTAAILIHILDVNDNSPVFDSKLDFGFKVSEAASINGTFDKVVAVDADAGLNGEVTYAIKSGNGDGDLYIDSTLGSLVVVKSLDHETISSYNLTIEAKDGGSPPRVSLKQILVRVKDENDNAPMFVNSSGVTLRVREDMPIGSVVAQFLATDRDSGENGVVLFRIKSGDINSAFQLDSQSGVLRNSRSLDYETRRTYNLTITGRDNASANPLESSIWVVVSLIDVNDNKPKFSLSRFTEPVYEDIPVFASVRQVTATDGDHGTNGEIRYSLSNQMPPPSIGQSMMFTIEPVSGIVRTLQSLAGTVSAYDLTIVAEDQSAVLADRLNATTTLRISIQKAITCPQVSFLKKDPLTVAEDAPINQPLLVVAASVTKSDCSQSTLQFGYALDHGNDGNTFQLDRLTGELKLLKALDRETQGQYNLSIHAYGAGAPPLIVARLLQVIVSDINDNSPIFDSVSYSAAVYEGTTEGMQVVKVHADDDDLGNNGDVTYTITAGNQYGFFAIDNSTGWIQVASVIILPQGQSLVRLTVRAEDRGVPSRWSTVEVAVSVRARCIPPTFLKTGYVFPVGENNPDNATVGVVLATDSASRQVIYQFVGTRLSNLFVVDANSGEITVTRALDYEKEQQFDFMVQAFLVSACNSSLQASVPVKVEVIDANDNNPVFEKSKYDGRVNETAVVGHPVLRVKADDADSGSYGTLVYSLKGDDGGFAVNASTGWISIAAPLDREKTSSYIFLVQASEAISQSPQSTYAPVRVVIDDANDNAPVFTQSSYEVNVSSQVTPGIPVVQMVALDADTGSNGEVSYSFESAPKGFMLCSRTGLINISDEGVSAGSLYKFNVIATDKGSPPVTSRQQVKVLAVDPSTQTLPPRFLQSTIRRLLDENTGARYQLATVDAVSDRPGANIRYSLFEGNTDGKFSIEPTGGFLTLVNSLDADMVDYYDLVVRADDQHRSGALHTDMHVYVNVTPVSGDITEFIRPRIGYVLENQPVNTSVMTVTACNPFAPPCIADNLQYYLATDADSKAFVIDYQTGELRTAVSLDAERKQFYDVGVSAVDLSQGSQSGTATIQISVFDQNDNKPHFLPLSNLSVPENTSVGALIATLSATDNDVNHQLRYSLVAGADNKFLVHSSDGRVTVEFPLDYEITDLYEVSVAVYDGKFTDRAKFYVKVLDINDNRPKFVSSIYSSSILERSLPGTYVANVSATDKDSGANGVVRFALRDTGNKLFQIDPLTGIITCHSQVIYNYHGTNIYDLTVIAYDRGTPMLSAEATVSVSVVDLNDHAPKFASSPFLIQVPENAPQGATVGSVKATDDDKEGPNGEVIYQVGKGNGTQWFTVQLTTGAVVVVGQGFVRGETYSFHVTAFDLGILPQRLENTTSVHFKIVSKQPVVFNQTVYYATLPEDSQPGTLVVTVRAFAGSSQFSIPLEYQITAGSDRGKFVIDQSDGRIQTKTTLDFSSASQYELTVTATDKASSASSASATVQVTVTDVNNNAPVFRQSVYTAEVLENSIDGTIVTVSATDKDSGLNSRVWFSFVQREESRMFTINSTTGTIRAKEPLDFEVLHHYSFEVKAEDMGSPPLSSTATVEVTVRSENEYAPVFESSSYEFSIGATTRPGVSIGRVTALDRDHGRDGDIRYSFSNIEVANSAGVSIRENDGVIIFEEHPADRNRRSTTSTTSRVRRGVDYSLTAVASDDGKPSKSATADVVIHVTTTGGTDETSGGGSSSSQTIIIVVAVVVVVLLVLCALLFLVLWRRKRTGNLDLPSNRKPITLYVASNPAAQSQERHQRQQEQQQQVEMSLYPERPVDIIGAAKDVRQSNTSLSASGRFRSQEKLLRRSPQDSSNSSVVEHSPDDDDMSPGEEKMVVLPSVSESSAGSTLLKKAYSPSQSRTESEMRTNSDAGSVRSGVRQDIDPNLMQNIWRDLENMGLMKDGQESTYDFNIQGGGEADGGIDVSNLLNTRLAEADADEFDAIIDGTRAFSYEGASDTVTVSAGGSVTSAGYADDDLVPSPYGQDYRRPWLSEISRARSPKQPPPMPAPVRPGMVGFSSQNGRPLQSRHALPNPHGHGRRPGAPPVAGKHRLGRGMKNNGLSPCISPGVSMSTSLATTPAATPSAGNLSPIVSPTLSPSERTESRGSTPSITPTHSSVSELDNVDR